MYTKEKRMQECMKASTSICGSQIKDICDFFLLKILHVNYILPFYFSPNIRKRYEKQKEKCFLYGKQNKLPVQGHTQKKPFLHSISLRWKNQLL